jgi:hypothetical protein
MATPSLPRPTSAGSRKSFPNFGSFCELYICPSVVVPIGAKLEIFFQDRINGIPFGLVEGPADAMQGRHV